jgi:hypothetical protein
MIDYNIFKQIQYELYSILYFTKTAKYGTWSANLLMPYVTHAMHIV